MRGENGAELGGPPPSSSLAPESASKPVRRNGRYDAAARRTSKRTGREKGCWVYIPAEVLDKTGYGGDGPPPYFRIWGAPRGRLTIQLYREG